MNDDKKGRQVRSNRSWLLVSSARLFVVLLLLWMLITHFTIDLRGLRWYSGDEGNWIHFGERAFRLAFLERNYGETVWAEDFHNFGARNPVLGKYLMGAALYAAGYGEEDVGGPYTYVFHNSVKWNRERGNLPPVRVIVAARLPVALLGVGTCLLVLLIGRIIQGWRTGLIALVWLAGNELMLESSRAAMTDVPETLFISLTCLVLLVSLQHWNVRTWQSLAWAALIGMSAGLAISTKMRALLALLAISAAYLVLLAVYQGREGVPAHSRGRCLSWIVACWLVAIVTSIGVFVMLNPYLYHDTVAHVRYMLRLGTENVVKLQAMFPKTALTTLRDKLYWFWRINFLEYGTLARAATRSVVPWGQVVDAMLVALGFVWLVKDAVAELRKGMSLLRTGLLVWVLVSVLGVLIWTPFRWPRYYIYVFPYWAVLVGYGLSAMLAWGGWTDGSA